MKRTVLLKDNHSKIQVINLVRSFSILLVMGGHYAVLMGFQNASESLKSFSRFFQNGSYGVSLFFVISGFLITRLLAQSPLGLYRPTWKEFYARRVSRLFPLLAADLLLGIALLVIGGPHTWSLDFCFRNAQAGFGFLFWLSILTFTFNWYRILGETTGAFGLHWDVLWSLAIEEQFYLFYPLLLKRLRNEKNLALFLAGIIFLGPLTRFWAFENHPSNYLWSFTNSFGAFDQIAFGALLYLLSQRHAKTLAKNPRLCACLAVLGFLGVIGVYFGTSTAEGIQRVYAPSLLALGLCVFLAGALHLSFFESKAFTWLSWLGQASYGAYLLHGFGLYLLYSTIANLNAFLAFAIVVIFMTVMAQFSYQFYEVPMNFRFRRFFEGLKRRKS